MGRTNVFLGKAKGSYDDKGVGPKTGGVFAGQAPVRWVSKPMRGGSDGDRGF